MNIMEKARDGLACVALFANGNGNPLRLRDIMGLDHCANNPGAIKPPRLLLSKWRSMISLAKY